jgi:multicomponent K+:H+ antiporter subunit D
VGADVAGPWLLPVALGTIALGMLGAIGSRELRRMQGYLLVGSIGIMLAPIALFSAASIAAGLFYLVHSTVVMAGMFLLSDLIARQRGGKDDLLVSGPAVRQPGVLGALFFIGAIAVAGLPPLSGFVGKALILAAVVPAGALPWRWGFIRASGLLSLVAQSRAGIVLFWDFAADEAADDAAPWTGVAVAPVAGLFVVVIALTVFAGPLTAFTEATAAQLLAPDGYVRAVLGGGR